MLDICYFQARNEVHFSSESDFACCIWDNVLATGHTWPFSWHQLTSLHCPFPLLLQPNEEYNDVVWDLPHHEHRPGETDGCLQTHSLPCWSTKRYSVMIRYNDVYRLLIYCFKLIISSYFRLVKMDEAVYTWSFRDDTYRVPGTARHHLHPPLNCGLNPHQHPQVFGDRTCVS